MKNVFDPEEQIKGVSPKIIAGIERLYTVFRSAMQKEAKQNDVTPLQAQLLLFIAGHDDSLCTVTRLAEEFVVTKPTISDSVRVLVEKTYLEKKDNLQDSRAYVLVLTSEGKKVVKDLYKISNTFSAVVGRLDENERSMTWHAMFQLIHVFQMQGMISCRMCMTCRYFEERKKDNYCNLLQSPLANNDLRLDCPEHEKKH